jgi:hypothetical protein
MAMGTNGYLVTPEKSEAILPHLAYLRFNISAASPARYAQIHGVPERFLNKVLENARHAVAVKKRDGLAVTLGLQMVLKPEYVDQVLPLAALGKALGVDYLVIKHCSDDESGSLGVNYRAYHTLYPVLREAEALSTDTYLVKVKWTKIEAEGQRSYRQCYGPPFILQVSGSGLVAPCGMFFGKAYRRYWIGNIVEQRFAEIWASQRYWDVMAELASPNFNAQTMCGCLCLQHKVNEFLDEFKQGRVRLGEPSGPPPLHLNFV